MITFFSDLHLEHSGVKLNPAGTGAIAFLGDLFASRNDEFNFIYWLERQDFLEKRDVIVIPGNHDFEMRNIDDLVDEWKILAKSYKKLHVLHNDSIIIDGVRYFGSPWYPGFEGWTDFENLYLELGYKTSEEANKEDVYEFLNSLLTLRVNDFRLCKDNDKFWSVQSLVKRHQEAREVLSCLVNVPFQGPTVALTHWGPTAYTTKIYEKDPFNLYFQNRDEDLLSRVDAWCHGHQHQSFHYHYGNDKSKGWVATNPRGTSPNYNLGSNPKFDLQGRSWSLEKGFFYINEAFSSDDNFDVWEPNYLKNKQRKQYGIS